MNGWKNYETWNVSLWLQNDESLYAAALWHGEHGESYTSLVRWLLMMGKTHTPDGVPYASRAVSRAEISKMLSNIAE